MKHWTKYAGLRLTGNIPLKEKRSPDPRVRVGNVYITRDSFEDFLSTAEGRETLKSWGWDGLESLESLESKG